jgi:dipeptidase D
MEKKDLKPAGVFKYFEEICQVPRPSKKEEKMIAYLKAFGAKHNLETKVDEAGNVLIKKPATPGKENLQTVVLQSHIDMVCEKNNDVQHDFLTDPIETEIDGEWLLLRLSFYFHNVLAKLTIKLPMLRLRLMPNCQE